MPKRSQRAARTEPLRLIDRVLGVYIPAFCQLEREVRQRYSDELGNIA